MTTPEPPAVVTGPSLLRWARHRQRRSLYASTFLLSAHLIAEAAVPIVVGLAMGNAVATGDGTALVWWLLALGLVYGVLTTAMRYGLRTSRRAVQGSDHDLRMLLADRLLDRRGGVGGLTGSLLSTATSDTTTLSTYHYTIAMAVSGFAGVGVAAYALARFSLALAGLAVGGTVVLLVLTTVAGRPLARRSGAQRATMAAATGLATDLLAGLRVLKGFGGEQAARDRYRRASREALAATLRAAVSDSAVRALAVLLAGLLLAVVTYFGGRLAADGSISLGGFITAIALAQFLLDPLNRITGIGAQRARSRVSADRIAAVLTTPYAVGGSRALSGHTLSGHTARPHPVPGITLDCVCSGPLQNLSLQVLPGEFLGIACTDPAAAAALLALLARDTDAEGGNAALDGEPLADLDADSVRSVLLASPRQPRLFAGTVLENIRAAAPDGVLDPVLDAAAVDDLKGALSDGLDTTLTEGGASLSGGQRQRVALARALAADPPVLALHEPTTAVDSLTELNIAAGIRLLRTGKTTIAITTSPAILCSCDRVVLIEGGAVAAQGTHDELAGSSPRYRELVLA